jgi:hypothetical protein
VNYLLKSLALQKCEGDLCNKELITGINFTKKIIKIKTMEHVQDNTSQQTTPDNTTHHFTPHELVEQHMQHPAEPITDADVENLDLKVNPDASPGDEIILTPEEKKSADEFADAIKSGSTGMCYDADL